MQLKNILLIIVMMIGICAHAQETAIFNGVLTDCDGFVTDTGLSAADYGNNESFELTICPEAPETVVNLYFNIFDLGAGDTIWVYDGDNTSAPLFGAFANNEAQTTDFFTGDLNTSTCLTIVFESDGSDVGNFACEVSCGYPCERPIAVVETGQEVPVLACVGEEINLDATGSTVADGFEIIEWIWDYGDNTTNDTDGAISSHSYDSPGDYRIQLYITDNNECSNNNLVDILVLVSTEPSFANSSTDLYTCQGVEVELHGEVTPTTWTGIPNVNFGGGLFIPDDQYNCFDSEITFTGFNPGDVIEDASDLDYFFMNFEHSFMGDLTIAFICPTGESIFVHQQGGGGTWLGEPIDDESDTPGVGYDYYWAPDAILGTWEDEAGAWSTLPAGTYSSVQSFDNLIGCPLNGTWTVEICDLWGIDNGFIFDWTIAFDPSFYPEVITFTPSFGAECDSTSWTGPGILSESADCNDITVLHDELGIYEYTFTGTDNHGCSYEHTVDVEVVAPPDIDASAVALGCDGTASLSSQILNPDFNIQTYSYEWEPSDLVINPNSAFTETELLDFGTNYTFDLIITSSLGEACNGTASVDVMIETPPPVGIEGTGASSICPGDAVSISATGNGGTPGYSYLWDTNQVSSTISVSPLVTTDYSVTVIDQCGETATTVVTVVVEDYDPIEINTVGGTSNCPGDPVSISATASGGIPEYSYLWENGDEESSTTVSPNETTDYAIIVFDQCGSATVDVTVVVDPPGTELVGIPMEICAGTELANPQISGGSGTYSIIAWPPEIIVTEEFYLSSSVPGTYFIGVIDDCIASGEIQVDVLQCEIFIPNVISPNGDNYNQYFYIDGLQYLDNSDLKIYNRWGNLVYEDSSYENDWDAGDVSEGTYYFILTLKTGEVHDGHVTVIK